MPWYEDGLRFSCTGCGHCCRVPGYVWVDRRRARAIARFLGLGLEGFGRRFLRRIGRRLSLTERDDLSCVFWDEEDGCTIYPVRPEQCRTFPFWRENLESPEAWEACGEECEGVGEGRLYRLGEIDSLAAGRGATVADEDEG